MLLPATFGLPCVSAFAAFWESRADLFFDERFDRARHVAVAWSAPCRLIAVQGDLTPVWLGGLDRAARQHGLTLRGVTTASFHFCLKVLLCELARVEARVARLDPNLFLWTMRTVPHPAAG